MAKLKKIDGGDHAVWVFWCPGCKRHHPFTVGNWHGRDGWKFNGDQVSPTFSPSLLVGAHGGEPRCHLFLEEGVIRYLADCDHALAGQTVGMVELVGEAAW